MWDNHQDLKEVEPIKQQQHPLRYNHVFVIFLLLFFIDHSEKVINK